VPGRPKTSLRLKAKSLKQIQIQPDLFAFGFQFSAFGFRLLAFGYSFISLVVTTLPL
jgi:hypothetical protein